MLGLLVAVGLIAANALFCAAEFAFIAVDRTRVSLMAAAGNRRARVLERMLPRLNFYLSGAQLGITITSIGLGFVAQPYIAAVLSPLLENVFSPRTADGVALVIALALATVLQLVFAEVVPKNVAVSRPEATGLALAPAMRLLSALFGPVIRFLNATSVWLVRRLGVEPREELESIRSVDELELLIQTSAEQGSLGREATQLLTRSIRFGDKEAAEILVPRPDLVGVPVTATVADLATASLASGYSRLPVYGGDIDDVLGVALAKDVLKVAPEARATTPVTDLMQPVPAVPLTARLDALLSEMRATGKQLVLVVDEYGVTAGILTLEDLLEEIVGEIEDEHDAPELTPPAPPGLTVLDGGLNLDELAEAIGLHLPEGDYETLAGFLLAQLDRIPEVGDEVVWHGWRFEVLEMERRRVARVVVHPPLGGSAAGRIRPPGRPGPPETDGDGPGEPDEPAEPSGDVEMSALALGAALALVLANGVFVAFEFSLVAARRSRLEARAVAGSRRARLALAAVGDLAHQIAGVQLGITMSSLGLGALGEPAIARLLEGPLEALGLSEHAVEVVAFAIALTIVVFLHTVLGELVPKYLAIAEAERTLLWLAVPMRAFLVVFGPVIRALDALARAVMRVLGVRPRHELIGAHSPEELARVVRGLPGAWPAGRRRARPAQQRHRLRGAAGERRDGAP